MSEPPESVSGDEICPICGKPKSKHSSKEIQKCSENLVKDGMMRYCGLTKPANLVKEDMWKLLTR